LVNRRQAFPSSRHDRPVLEKALAALERGDTLACFKLDRLGRSLAHLVRVIEDLDARGIHFMTAEDGLSTKGSTGKLVLNILGSIAQFERNLMLERTRAGLAAAKAQGRVGGRPRRMGPAEVTKARQMLKKGELNADDVAAMLKVSRRTLFRELRAAQDREDLETAQ
jgi:DNA invertase Pin-like site-specific DNA recombinase